MTTCFDRWEKDPFFSAAEEVQESTDRMESVYRRWIHERRAASDQASKRESFSDELLADLRTALGTAKWQLEEFERAVRPNDASSSLQEDARSRHIQFLSAIGSQIAIVENSLRETNQKQGESTIAWVRLDEGERDELALFLSKPLPEREKVVRKNGEDECVKNVNNVKGFGRLEKKQEKLQGHRRTASASADIGSWKILVSDEDAPRRSFEEQPRLPPLKIPSLSCLTKALESKPKMKWSGNVFRKCKGGDHQQAAEMMPLQNNQTNRELDAFYDRSKSCLGECEDEIYSKQLYGWIGALHRRLQRSQYQIQYGRPILIVFWAVLLLSSVVVFVKHVI
ncbi:uncharacterized protein [Typha latifolia]|uniref:uncharacterized protein n=1 Tax=Typha latifolia TaxID=4733 RepID=UPI003C2D38DB